MPTGGEILAPLDRQFDPPEPVRPANPWGTPAWFIGLLVVTVLAVIIAALKVPLWVPVVIWLLVLLVALAHYYRVMMQYELAAHLREIQVTSRDAVRVLFRADVVPVPDLLPLSSHFPMVADLHSTLFNRRNQTTWSIENGESVSHTPDATETALPSDEVMPLLLQNGDLLKGVWNANTLPGTCGRCRWRVWLYRVLKWLP